jgi:DNA-binding NarL/FixJ family response regulator
MYQESHLAAEAFRLGASAYLSKHAAGEELIDAIHEIAAAAGTNVKG